MKMRDCGLSLVGGALVYVAMAACSGGSAGRGTGGAATRSGPGLDSGIIDALIDPVPTASADPQSGGRLKAQYRIGDDGSKEYLAGSWFDVQRNEACSFGPAADGKERCLPDGAIATVFADSMCQTPVLAMSSGCSPPAYALVLSLSTCDANPGATHVYSVGAQTTPTALYVQAGSNCYQAGSAASGYTYYAVGPEVPPSSFVAGTTQHD